MGANSLERVSTRQQTSLGYALLPLEIQQQVFAYLDPRSFYAARYACKWWYFASLDAVTLARQLRKLPIRPHVNASTATPDRLHKLFLEASHTLMLDLRIRKCSRGNQAATHVSPLSPSFSPQITATKSGERTATIYDGNITLFDTSTDRAFVLAQRRLNDLKEALGSGPWLKVGSMHGHHLALSSDATLLAVAQERTIQVYDLTAAADSFTVNEYLPSVAGHSISGLSFEQHDHVLRVDLSGRGSVLYLGSPSASGDGKADMEHWKSKAGLKHLFLDSSTMASSVGSESEWYRVRLSGVQLLRPFMRGFLFAAQRHGGNESSHYVVGHIECSGSAPCGALTVNSERITILSRLESFLSAWEYTTNGLNDSGMGMWENMPSAHEHHPRFSMSPDGTIIVLAEQDKKQIRPLPLTQLFVYRLSAIERLGQQLCAAVQSDAARDSQGSTGFRVGRIPKCLCTISGTTLDMQFERTTDDAECLFTVTTSEAKRSWVFQKI